jgi:hypothetical protein
MSDVPRECLTNRRNATKQRRPSRIARRGCARLLARGAFASSLSPRCYAEATISFRLSRNLNIAEPKKMFTSNFRGKRMLRSKVYPAQGSNL